MPLQVPEDCPQAVVDLYTECTAVDPADRPTARQLVERLTQIIHATQPAAKSPVKGGSNGVSGAANGTAAANGLGSSGSTKQGEGESGAAGGLARQQKGFRVVPPGAAIASPFAAMRGEPFPATGAQGSSAN